MQPSISNVVYQRNYVFSSLSILFDIVTFFWIQQKIRHNRRNNVVLNKSFQFVVNSAIRSFLTVLQNVVNLFDLVARKPDCHENVEQKFLVYLFVFSCYDVDFSRFLDILIFLDSKHVYEIVFFENVCHKNFRGFVVVFEKKINC